MALFVGEEQQEASTLEDLAIYTSTRGWRQPPPRSPGLTHQWSGHIATLPLKVKDKLLDLLPPTRKQVA